VIGSRFHSSSVTRVADAKPVQLGHAARADGRWRLYAFADASRIALDSLCEYLANSPDSPLQCITLRNTDPDSVFDLRAVLQEFHREVRLEDLPALLLPRKGRYGLVDYEKTFTNDAATDIFDERGVDRERGALVVVRPDQFVAHVLPLDAHAELSAFLRPIFRVKQHCAQHNNIAEEIRRSRVLRRSDTICRPASKSTYSDVGLNDRMAGYWRKADACTSD